MTNCEYCGTKLQWHGGSWEPPADERDAEIARLTMELQTAERAFDLLAAADDSMINGVRPSARANVIRKALRGRGVMDEEDYFGGLLVGAEPWAIEQVREESAAKDAKIARLRELLAEWLKFPYPDARTDKLAEATEKALRGEE